MTNKHKSVRGKVTPQPQALPHFRTVVCVSPPSRGNLIYVLRAITVMLLLATPISSTTYDVGPAYERTAIGDVPWQALAAGDSIHIHWRAEPYREKWVICARGTQELPITISGVPGPDGQLPVVDGRDAVTPKKLNYWNEPRGIIKVGGANVATDTMPAYITIENLDIRSGRPPYQYTGREGIARYANNAAAIFIEKGEHITIRNCRLTDCGNGFFCASQSSDILVEKCLIRDNGIEDRFYEHNSYTEAKGIVFQFNHYGPLRKGCLGNNLKDRSAGTVVRYNWIEDGNRQLDLVDSGHEELIQDPTYRDTHVYGNILIRGDRQGNSQIVHYGGDSRKLDRYRKGTLHFYNNTVVSNRRDRTTLFRLSTYEEAANIRNNIFHTAFGPNLLAITNAAGRLNLIANWLSKGWHLSHDTVTGPADATGNIDGSEPGFIDSRSKAYHLMESSECIDAGASTQGHRLDQEYQRHRESRARFIDTRIDLGAYEFVR